MEEKSTRKGPWTEQEDLQLVFSVRLFGERHWDFIAQVSGLNRTGKSCRLRWVNYLHPGLKRGRMSPEEERLVLELHARWGNRWSRIARRLPGRTDNEIKNYWRTHMRKRAQERKRSCTSSSSSSLSTSLTSSSSSSSLLNLPMTGPPLGISMPDLQGGREGCSAAGGPSGNGNHGEVLLNGFPMEQIWNVMESSEMRDVSAGDGEFYSCKQEASLSTVELSRVPMLSPPWDCSWDTLWKMDEEEYKILLKQDHHQGSTET